MFNVFVIVCVFGCLLVCRFDRAYVSGCLLVWLRMYAGGCLLGCLLVRVCRGLLARLKG